jgi:hypothetical protein
MLLKEIIIESKARIEHPEDLILDNGSVGAANALKAIIHAASDPKSTSIKMDGSPSLIFGNDENGFVVTDKAGFNKKDGSGMPRTAKAVYQMLFNRRPDDPGRSEYSQNVAALFPYLKALLPNNFKGYLQADVLWFSKPKLVNGNYIFKPNKVQYSIPANSELGKKITNSSYGITIHSYFKDKSEPEPVGIDDLASLHLNEQPKLVVVDPKLSASTVSLPAASIKQLSQYINNNKNKIDSFLNQSILSSQKISDLPAVMKSFLAYAASQGKELRRNLPDEFLKYVDANAKLTANKKASIKNYCAAHKLQLTIIFNIVFNIVQLKNTLRSSFDKQATHLTAQIGNYTGHEGFVSNSPHGKIKLVNRPVFMRKE